MKKLITLLMLLPVLGYAQDQVADNDYQPVINTPLFEQGKGPLILVDGGHNNFHTLESGFAPFGKVAASDGFTVRSIAHQLKPANLEGVRILVVANALNEKNIDNWKQPVHPAFTPDEVEVIRNWVHNGGRLFLIADHMPFAGAAGSLAQAVGYTFYDGFAMSGPGKKFDVFCNSNGMLQHTEVTDLHGSIDSIITYTGQAFKIPGGAKSILTFGPQYKVLMPEEAWKFSRDMKMMPAESLSQLAYSQYGSGKVVVAGEAAMFTAQKVPDVVKFGLNADIAHNNLQLLLNVLEWLNE